ncbi:SPOR domain-containing protein [Defluviimonas sp. D31]|uniref:SPOR domain-containing protein n=1 Tax=Defluviimonas sp. D31 TaxID=3083253 RepID=UPI00296FC658|nr:SPOR domain-containing protein [Defluviimonas sp. D31]
MARGCVVIATMVALAGCQNTGQTSGAGPTSGATGKAAAVQHDVESPEVFNLTGDGLWDGRPSLGGVWVAHATVTDPERVMIRNTVNGKSVVGALFRRERENPGPSLQVSSDAADALGMLAGQPAKLSVVALRTKEVPAAAPAEPEAAVPAKAAEPPAAKPAAAGAATSATAPAAASAAAAAPEPKTGGFFGLFRKKPEAPAAAVETPAAASNSGSGIEQSTLEPVTAAAAAAIDRAESEAAAKPATAAKPAAATAPAAGAAPKSPYVQVAILSTEANAQSAASQLRAAGMTATARTGTSGGKPIWRVLVGPAASVAERDTLIARVKKLGYSDAYPVSK